jgi:hypothetical protein
MTCAVCGAATSGQSTICSSCDQVVGHGRFAATGGRQSPASRHPEDVSSGMATVWFVVLLAITLGSAFVTVGRPTNPYTSGEYLGNVAAHMLLAVIIAGVLRWTAKARFTRTFLITWAVLIPLLFVSGLTQRHQLQNQGVHQALLDLRKVMTSKNPATGTSVAPTANEATPSDGGNGSALQVAIEHIAQNATGFKQQEMVRQQRERDLHIELVLQPQRLVSAEGIAQSRSSIDQYRALMTERKTALKAFEDQNQSYLMQLPEPMQDAALRGFLKARVSADQAFEQYFLVENSTADTFDQVLDVAQKALGRSRLDGNGKLMLPEPMHSEMAGLWQTIQQEITEEAQAKQNMQILASQQQQNMDQLLQQTSTPGSSQ